MLCRMKLLLALLAPIGALKMELTDTNFKKSLEGKNAFVFFQAPWCGHCRKLQPEWDQMAKLFADTPNVIIGQVDCTGSGQGFCGENGVQGYPTLKLWKDGRMQDYNGGRDFNSLKREVERKLDPRPACSLESKDACKPEDRVILEESEKMSKAERAAKIKEVQQEIQDAKTQAAELEKKAKKLAESLDLIKGMVQTLRSIETEPKSKAKPKKREPEEPKPQGKAKGKAKAKGKSKYADYEDEEEEEEPVPKGKGKGKGKAKKDGKEGKEGKGKEKTPEPKGKGKGKGKTPDYDDYEPVVKGKAKGKSGKTGKSKEEPPPLRASKGKGKGKEPVEEPKGKGKAKGKGKGKGYKGK